VIYLKWIGGILTVCILVTVFFVVVNEIQTRKEIKKGRKR
jgi:cell division protein FtsX